MSSAHLSMDAVIELGLKLPDVVESSHYGARALKLNGRMLACTPVNKSAEANSAAVAIDPEQRATLLRKHPSHYYITEHYAPHPTMLIRLSSISRTELQRILRLAWDFVSINGTAPRSQVGRSAKRPRTRSGKLSFKTP
jgi:hypothetical protein